MNYSIHLIPVSVINIFNFHVFFQVGSVIKNPEISALVPTLLKGLSDPNEHTKYSLDILLQVRFTAFTLFILFIFLLSYLICLWLVADNLC